MKQFPGISQKGKLIALSFLVLLITIFFESAQQLFYIRSFNIREHVSFWDLLRNHAYTWLIWLVLAFFLARMVPKRMAVKILGIREVFVGLGYIFIFVFIGCLLVALTQWTGANSPKSISTLFTEFIPFYLFQKMPIYTLSYIAVVVIAYFYTRNESLKADILELQEIKALNEERYDKLRQTYSEKASVLSVKVGNRYKVIPVETIRWIEADDYCVKVHPEHLPSYAVRISMKAMEERLGHGFLRVHRKAIVNLKKVAEFENGTRNRLRLKSGDWILVSKTKVRELKKRLLEIGD